VQPGGRELVEALSHDQADAVLCILADRLRWAASDAALVARLDATSSGSSSPERAPRTRPRSPAP